MKKMIYSIRLLMICIALGVAMPSMAQNDNDREDTRNERLTDRDDDTDRNRDDLRDEDENEARNEDDDDDNYGWIGLIGLAGLAGLLRRPEKRTVHVDTGYRSTNTGTGRTDLGSGTSNRTV